MLASLWRWISGQLALAPDLKRLDDGALRPKFGDDPWDVWGDE